MLNKVLIYSRFPKALMLRIGERFELMDGGGKPPGEVFTADQLAGVRAMITAGGTPLGGAMMDTMPKLGAIVCYGTGYDGVDLAAAAKRGIAVGHSPGANAASVADIAVTLMLAVTRRLLPADQLCPQRQLGRGKTVAADAAAAGQSRPQGRRLRHGRDRPQDRRPRCGVRDRCRPISAAAGTTCPINICRAWRRWRNGAAC